MTASAAFTVFFVLKHNSSLLVPFWSLSSFEGQHKRCLTPPPCLEGSGGSMGVPQPSPAGTFLYATAPIFQSNPIELNDFHVQRALAFPWCLGRMGQHLCATSPSSPLLPFLHAFLISQTLLSIGNKSLFLAAVPSHAAALHSLCFELVGLNPHPTFAAL